MSFEFKSVTKAAEFLSATKGVDLLSARDCIYKSLKRSKPVTHGYTVSRNDKIVTLTEVEKKNN